MATLGGIISAAIVIWCIVESSNARLDTDMQDTQIRIHADTTLGF